jgi:hypothetical protein
LSEVETNEAGRSELEEYNRRHPVRRNPDTDVVTDYRTGKQKQGLLGRVKQGLEERSREHRELKEEAKTVEKTEYRKGFLEGRKKSAYEKGKKAGMGGSGVGGFLTKAGGFAQRHVGALSEPGSVDVLGFGSAINTKGLEDSLSFGGGRSGGGFRVPNASEVGFGFGSTPRRSAPRKKGKKRSHRSAPRDPFADLGF